MDDDFYNSNIVYFGGTALVPQLHDNLSDLLEKAKQNKCITVVNTVFDFRSEKKNPGYPWPLDKSPEHFKLIDLLILDAEEALKITGRNDLHKAAEYLIQLKVSSFIITDGAHNVLAWSGGGLFKKTELLQMPVSEKVKSVLLLRRNLSGETTGCGDNFAGGVITSLAMQLNSMKTGKFSLTEAIS